MKSRIAHYKSKARKLSVRSIALMLCAVMLLTTVGAITMLTAFAVKANNADAATTSVPKTAGDDTGSEGIVLPKLYKKIIDLAETGYGTASIYYTTSSSGMWNTATTQSVSLSANKGSASISLDANTTYYFIIKGDNTDWWGNTSFDLSSIDSQEKNLVKYNNFSASSTDISTNPNTLKTSTAASYTFELSYSGSNCTCKISGGGETPTEEPTVPTEAPTEPATEDVSAPHDDTPTTQTSGQTLFVSKDNATDNTWTYIYTFSGYTTGTYSMTQTPAAPNNTLTSVYYFKYDVAGKSLGNNDIKIVLRKQNDQSDWSYQSANIEISNYTKGKQGYSYWSSSTHGNNSNNKDNPNSGLYTALKLEKITRPTVPLAGVNNAMTVTVSGGLPKFLKETCDDSSGTGKYRLTVTEGGNNAATDAIADLAYGTESTHQFSFNWNPTAGSHTLVYTLTDGIDTVTSTETYTVKTRLATPTNVKMDTKDSSSVTAAVGTKSTLSWDAVTNATSYKIYKVDGEDDVLVGTSDTTSYQIERGYSKSGDYKVVAVPSSAAYVASDKSSAATLTVNKNQLARPVMTFSNDTAALSCNNTDSVTLTITNYDDLKTYCSFTNASDEDVEASISSSGAVTVDNVAALASYDGKANNIAVKATIDDYYADYYEIYNGSAYAGNATSANCVLTVYEPIYSLIGHMDWIKNAETDTWGSGTDWDAYNASYAIDNVTSTPGVYNITITSGTDGPYDIGIYKKDDKRYGFRLGTTYYNKSNDSGIYTVPDAGVAYSDNLYAQIMDNDNPGGSLELTASTVYVIEIDQRYRVDDSNPYGKFAIYTGKSIINARVKKMDYNLTNGTYDAVADGTAANGSAQATPNYYTTGSTGTTSLSATAASGYTFVGWYSDSACTTSVSASAAATITNVSNTNHDFYALFKQNEPSKYSATAAATKHGALQVTWNSTSALTGTGQADPVVNTVKNIPAGATVTITTTPDAGYVLDTLTVNRANGAEVTKTVVTAGTSYRFTMPAGNVTVKAAFDVDYGSVASGKHLLFGNANGSGNPTPSEFDDNTVTNAVVVTTKTISGVEHNYAKIPISEITDVRHFVALSDSASYTDMFYRYKGATFDRLSGNVHYPDGDAAYYTEAPNSWAYWQDSYDDYFFVQFKLNQAYKEDIKYILLDAYYDNSLEDAKKCNYSLTVVLDEDAPAKTIVYAKDAAAPINWNNKEEAGASDFSGTSFTLGAIAQTKIVKFGNDVENWVNPAAGTVTTVTLGGTDTVDGTKDYASSKYDKGIFSAGKFIKVETTIASAFKEKYFVRGWCINGLTYKSNGTVGVNDTPDTTNGLYTLVYQIPEGNTDPIEITPIYYYTDTYKATLVADATENDKTLDFVTFYLQGYQDDGDWGNTPYIYPFYGELYNVDNSFATYPGQPMVNVGGTYSVEIPTVNIDILSDDDDHLSTYIKGITISNGYADHVHRNLIYDWSTGVSVNDDVDHKQTYDYDDFYKIYHENTKMIGGKTEHPNTITFRMEDRDDTFNAKTYGGMGKGVARVTGAKNTLSDADISAIRGQNGWKLLTDFFDEPVNIFNKSYEKNAADVGGAALSDEEPLYVISTGYNGNIAGDYGTAWKIFAKVNGTYTLIQDSTSGRYAIPPSVLTMASSHLSSDHNSFTNSSDYPVANRKVDGLPYTDDVNKYANIYHQLQSYNTKKVYIAYEQNTQDIRSNTSGEGAYRMDGRWMYTFSDDTVKANTKIEYFDITQNKYVADTYATEADTDVTGVTTGANAYFSDDSKVTKTRQSAAKSIKQQYYNLFADEDSTVGTKKYVFVGWEAEIDGKRTKMTGIGNEASLLAESTVTYVAKYMPEVKGSMTIKHTVDKNSEGKGTVGLTVKVYDGDNIILEQSDPSQIYLNENYIANDSTYRVEITLEATPYLDDTFDTFTYEQVRPDYVEESADPAVDPENPANWSKDTTPVTSKFSFNVSDLFPDNVNQSYDTFNYTSSFNSTMHHYEIKYTYPKREGGNGEYTAKGTIESDVYDNSKYVLIDGNTRTLTGSFIKSIAPHESNFNQVLNIDIDAMNTTVTKNAYDAATKTHQVEAVFSPTARTYAVDFKLPYAYETSTGTDIAGQAYKKYTGHVESVGGQYVVKMLSESYTVSMDGITYGDYVTSNTGNAQTNVNKDSATPNHVNNSFITAPEAIYDEKENKELHFCYWEIRDLDDNDTVVARVYYPDFHNRVYGNYQITPHYSATDSYLMAVEAAGISANMLYLGSSRNQWNDADGDASTDAFATAADRIFNDFSASYTYNGKIISELSAEEKAKIKIGMIIETIQDTSVEGNPYIIGSPSTAAMSGYRTSYDATGTVTDADARKAALENWLSGKGSTGLNGMKGKKVSWDISALNNKNRLEQYYYFDSQYGQLVEDHDISFKNDNPVDDYVYRAYAYIIVDDGGTKTAKVSDPAYFCMKYVSSK